MSALGLGGLGEGVRHALGEGRRPEAGYAEALLHVWVERHDAVEELLDLPARHLGPAVRPVPLGLEALGEDLVEEAHEVRDVGHGLV